MALIIYLITVFILSVPLVMFLSNFGFGTGNGLEYDIESMATSTSIIGGIILGIHYLNERQKKKLTKKN